MTLTPAFDKRSKDPKKDYGVHGVELRMILRGSKGVTQLVIYTNWMLPSVTLTDPWRLEPFAADLGYHAVEPQYEGQHSIECDLLPGGTCYYDGSGLNADRVFKEVLLPEGSDGVWAE